MSLAATVRQSSRRISSYRPSRCRRLSSSRQATHTRQDGPSLFDGPSKPREYYARPTPKDLPTVSARWPLFMSLGLAGISAWAGFFLYASNQERLSSSVLKQLTRNIKEEERLLEVLGDGIKPVGTWYMLGHPWVDGSINMLQGHVDLSLQIQGSEGAGTLYFTSIRQEKGAPFRILRYKVICDDGRIVDLTPRNGP